MRKHDRSIAGAHAETAVFQRQGYQARQRIRLPIAQASLMAGNINRTLSEIHSYIYELQEAYHFAEYLEPSIRSLDAEVIEQHTLVLQDFAGEALGNLKILRSAILLAQRDAREGSADV